jgi:hypothetical protein
MVRKFRAHACLGVFRPQRHAIVTKHTALCHKLGLCCPQQEGKRVHQNNAIYKGYRLTAKVARGSAAIPGMASNAPVFTAVVLVTPAALTTVEGDEYPIPCFVGGGFVYSPAEAVHAAVTHGREIVDAFTGFPTA